MNSNNKIKVWDPLVRIFHWGLVLAFFIAYITEEEFLLLHIWAGYTVLALVVLRLIWGFIGSHYARFSTFVFTPKVVFAYLKDTLALRAKRFIGHNPAGGAMILMLLVSLILTSFSGLAVYALEHQAGPLAPWLAHSSEVWEEALEEVHEFFANFTVLLVFFHVLGVLIESFLHGENLIRAMWTGYKRAELTPKSTTTVKEKLS